MKKSLEDTARRFDALADSWDDRVDVWLKRARQKVIAMARPSADDLVLDVGTGTGALAIELSPKVKEVIALDISPKMLERAAQKVHALRLRNVALEHGSFQNLLLKTARVVGQVSLVVSTYTLHHLDDDEKGRALEVLVDLLAPHGRVVIGDIMFFGDPGPHRDLYDPETDDPCPASFLEEKMRKLGLQVTTVKLHPVVGVLRGERRI